MQKYIAVAFTLKGQDFFGILPALKWIAENNPGAILVHGFMPKEVVLEKELSTNVVDTLATLFPSQVPFYKPEGPDRQAMKNLLYEKQGTAYLIGKISDGVREEALLYIKAGIEVVTLAYNQEKVDELKIPLVKKEFTEADLVDFGKGLLKRFEEFVLKSEGIFTDEQKATVLQISDADIANFRLNKDQQQVAALPEGGGDNTNAANIGAGPGPDAGSQQQATDNNGGGSNTADEKPEEIKTDAGGNANLTAGGGAPEENKVVE